MSTNRLLPAIPDASALLDRALTAAQGRHRPANLLASSRGRDVVAEIDRLHLEPPADVMIIAGTVVLDWPAHQQRGRVCVSIRRSGLVQTSSVDRRGRYLRRDIGRSIYAAMTSIQRALSRL